MKWLLGNSQWLDGRGPNLRVGSAEANVQKLLAAGATSLDVLWPNPKYWFQDAAGTRPVTSVGQPIRCWKSVNGTLTMVQSTSDDRAPVARRMPNGNWVAYFDGVDDGMQSSEDLNWSQETFGMAMAGLRKLGADGATQCAIGQGPASSASDGWSIFGPVGTSMWRSYCRMNGTPGGSSVTEMNYSGDNAAVVTCLMDGSIGRLIHRVGGMQRGFSSTPTAGLLARDKLNIGCRNGNTAYWNGYMGPVIIRTGAFPDEATLVAADALVNDYMLGSLDTIIRHGSRGAIAMVADPRYWFQDVAGTIPVTAVGQPIRCWLSTNGRRFIQPTSDDRAPTSSVLPNGQWSAFFDGVDDYLVSQEQVLFSDVSQIALFAGVRKMSDGYINCILSKEAPTNTGYFEMSGQRAFAAGIGTSKYAVLTRGSTSYVTSGLAESSWNTTMSAPHSAVMSANLVLSETARMTSLSVNGQAAATTAAAPGIGGYASKIVYVCCSPNLSNFFHGHITHLGMRMGGEILGALKRSAAENLINQHLGAF